MDREEILISIEDSIIRHYGPLINGKELEKILRYPTRGAFLKAKSRGLLPIKVFQIPNRKGVFALYKDLAEWMVNQSITEIKEEKM